MMAPKDWLAPYGCTALIVVSFAFIGAIVAWPLLGPLWSPQVTVAQFAPEGLK